MKKVSCYADALILGMCNNDRVLGRDSDDRSWKRPWIIIFWLL